MGGVVLRYAKIAFSSSSVNSVAGIIDIGGISGLVPSSPIHFFSCSAFKNCSSFQPPIPVESEVRFAANVVPHGPVQAVNVCVTIRPFLAASFESNAGGGICPGCPE